MYRAALTYHADVGTFRGARGAWRVLECWTEAVDSFTYGTLRVVTPDDDSAKILVMDSPRRLQPGTWINPRSLLPRSTDAAR